MRVAMSLDDDCQYDIRDMFAAIVELHRSVSDADITGMLCSHRGLSPTVCCALNPLMHEFYFQGKRGHFCCLLRTSGDAMQD